MYAAYVLIASALVLPFLFKRPRTKFKFFCQNMLALFRVLAENSLTKYFIVPALAFLPTLIVVYYAGGKPHEWIQETLPDFSRFLDNNSWLCWLALGFTFLLNISWHYFSRPQSERRDISSQDAFNLPEPVSKLLQSDHKTGKVDTCQIHG
ncbi:MAG: hypothetical protein ACOX5R_22130 [bacterium]|jgi:hypothetical protein